MAPASAIPKSERIRFLDGLRGIAAALAVLYRKRPTLLKIFEPVGQWR